MRSVRSVILPLLMIMACLTLLPVHAATPTSAQPLAVRAGIVTLTVQADSYRYVADQRVMLRASIRNEGSKKYYALALAPWHMLTLTLTNSKGDIIKSRGPVGADFPMEIAVGIPPGESYRIRAPDGSEWCSLTKWGYGALPPDTYSLKVKLNTVVSSHTNETAPNPEVSERFIAGGPGTVATVTFTVDAK